MNGIETKKMIAKDEVIRLRDEIIQKYGEWTDHNVHLVDDVYTINNNTTSDKLCRYLQIVSDIAQEPISNLRILDLACLEGLYAIEFARHGAQVVGIEGRSQNLIKAQFVKDVLCLDNLDFIQDDVRNLCKEKYGVFDVVLCSGILYHLDSPDIFEFMNKMSEVCSRFIIVDTYVSLKNHKYFLFQGKKYWGMSVVEHSTKHSQSDKNGNLWASLDNPKSVWVTRPSLLNLMTDVGFSSIYECSNPFMANRHRDRITLVGMKGKRQQVISLPPQVNAAPLPPVPEKEAFLVNPVQKRFYNILKRVQSWVPSSVKNPIKWFLRNLGFSQKQGPWEWEQPWKRRQELATNHIKEK